MIEIPHPLNNLFPASSLFVVLGLNKAGDKPFELNLYHSEDEWKRGREGHIGASEAATCMGKTDEWKTRKQFFLELTGQAVNEFEGNELTRIGQNSEPLIRALWAIEHPQFDVYDGTYLHFTSKSCPWESASLDMVIHDRERDKWYVGEIKTSLGARKWGKFEPDNYFIQNCQQLNVTGFDGVLTIPRIRPVTTSLTSSSYEKAYFFDANDEAVKYNMNFVRQNVRQFWEMVQSGEYKPSLNLF